MGRSIGTLGTVHEPLDLEFGYFGATIRLHPQASDTVELDFLEAGRDIDMSVFDKPVEALGADEQLAAARHLSAAVRAVNLLLRDSLRRLIHPDDFDTYWRLAVEHRQLIRDLSADVKRLTAAVVEADTGFPTMPPSGSPDGPAATQPRSAGGSSAADVPVSSSGALPRDLVNSLALDRGRPDFQASYLLDYLQRQDVQRQERDRERRDAEKMAAAGIG